MDTVNRILALPTPFDYDGPYIIGRGGTNTR